jgi:hypothetical protein
LSFATPLDRDPDASDRHVHPAADRHADLRHLLRQYLEMVVVMWVDMLVLGRMVRGALVAAGLAYSHARYAARPRRSLRTPPDHDREIDGGSVATRA